MLEKKESDDFFVKKIFRLSTCNVIVIPACLKTKPGDFIKIKVLKVIPGAVPPSWIVPDNEVKE